VFITGSAAGVQWIESVDRRPVADGKRGPIASALIGLYDRAVRGELPKYERWLTPAYAGTAPRAAVGCAPRRGSVSSRSAYPSEPPPVARAAPGSVRLAVPARRPARSPARSSPAST